MKYPYQAQTGYKIIGAGSSLLKDIEPGVENLFIPAPEREGVIRVMNIIVQRTMTLRNTRGVAITNVIPSYIDGAGNKASFSTIASVAANASQNFGSNNIIPMLQAGDGGLYVEYTGAAGGGVDVRGNWRDVQNLFRERVDLTTDFQRIHPVVEENQVLKASSANARFGAIFNCNVGSMTVESRLVTPEGTINFPAMPVTTPTFAVPTATVEILRPGWELQMRVTAAPTEPVICLCWYKIANLAPVRAYQGGAF